MTFTINQEKVLLKSQKGITKLFNEEVEKVLLHAPDEDVLRESNLLMEKFGHLEKGDKIIIKGKKEPTLSKFQISEGLKEVTTDTVAEWHGIYYRDNERLYPVNNKTFQIHVTRDVPEPGEIYSYPPERIQLIEKSSQELLDKTTAMQEIEQAILNELVENYEIQEMARSTKLEKFNVGIIDLIGEKLSLLAASYRANKKPMYADMIAEDYIAKGDYTPATFALSEKLYRRIKASQPRQIIQSNIPYDSFMSEYNRKKKKFPKGWIGDQTKEQAVKSIVSDYVSQNSIGYDIGEDRFPSEVEFIFRIWKEEGIKDQKSGKTGCIFRVKGWEHLQIYSGAGNRGLNAEIRIDEDLIYEKIHSLLDDKEAARQGLSNIISSDLEIDDKNRQRIASAKKYGFEGIDYETYDMRKDALSDMNLWFEAHFSYKIRAKSQEDAERQAQSKVSLFSDLLVEGLKDFLTDKFDRGSIEVYVLPKSGNIEVYPIEDC